MKPERILLINSDLAKNRGDRAIAEGIIQLLRARYPSAAITGISEQAARDKAWFGIDFLDMDAQSLSPLALLRLLRAAFKADLVLWGGGEILKDYTNRFALWYWCLKLRLVLLVNRNVYGAYQGIGPTSAESSKRIIAGVVKRCRAFIVRDAESCRKLIEWGVPALKVIASSDPAVLPGGGELSGATLARLQAESGIDTAFLDNFVCVGPRSWFHYRTGGLIPYKYKSKLLRLFRRQADTATPEYHKYLAHLVNVVDAAISRLDTNLLLVPMHMTESDPEICAYIRSQASFRERIRALDKDTLSPQELRAVMGRARAMVGFRLHSSIIATSSHVPSMNIYYVDKGRVYFEQIGQSRYSVPIARMLDEDFPEELAGRLEEVMRDRSMIRTAITAKVADLRELVQTSFDEAMRR